MKNTIKTNNQYREIINGFNLTKKEREKFDYYESDEELDCASFFRYKGNIYDLCEFMRTPKNDEDLKKWDGYLSETYFSGILVKYDDCGEFIKVGSYYS